MGSNLLSRAWNSTAMGTTRDAPFSHKAPPMAGFLRRLAAHWRKPHALVARNFLLDEGVADWRFGSYRDSGAVADHPDPGEWERSHSGYLTDHVFRPPDHGSPDPLEPADALQCPETFRQIDPASPFWRSDLGLQLVRVGQIEWIARRAMRPAARVTQLIEAAIAEGQTPGPAHQELDAVLAEWSAQLEVRPTFATYWEHVHDLFGQTPSEDRPNWPDAIRDRLGLYHLNPGLRLQASIAIVVFRYSVSDVPRLGNDRLTRPLVPPTVLDGPFSEAFCPAPYNEETGHAVDLSGDAPPLRREVLHPTLAFAARHVFRVGEVRRNVTEDELAKARAWHLECVRDATGRDDYGQQTDGDLASLI